VATQIVHAFSQPWCQIAYQIPKCWMLRFTSKTLLRSMIHSKRKPGIAPRLGSLHDDPHVGWVDSFDFD
jgi:hypothetical protein